MDEVLQIDLNIIHDVKKHKTAYTSYQIQSNETSFLIVAENIIEVLKPDESTSIPINFRKQKDKLLDVILEFVNGRLDKHFYKQHQQCKMEYIVALSPLEENAMLSKLTENEICLVCLGVTNLNSKQFLRKRLPTMYKKHRVFLLNQKFCEY